MTETDTNDQASSEGLPSPSTHVLLDEDCVLELNIHDGFLGTWILQPNYGDWAEDLEDFF